MNLCNMYLQRIWPLAPKRITMRASISRFSTIISQVHAPVVLRLEKFSAVRALPTGSAMRFLHHGDTVVFQMDTNGFSEGFPTSWAGSLAPSCEGQRQITIKKQDILE